MKTHQIGGTTYFFDGNALPNSAAALPPSSVIPQQVDSSGRRSASTLFIPPTVYAQQSAQPYPDYTAYPAADSESSSTLAPSYFGLQLSRSPIPPSPPASLLPQARGTPATPYRTAAQFFISEHLRHNLLRKAELQCPSVETPFIGGRAKHTPARVAAQYHTLRPIDEPVKTTRGLHSLFSEVQSEVYKCTNAESGMVCVLRRIISPQLAGDVEQFRPTIENWRQFSHPNAVSLRNVVACSDFSPSSNARELLFEYHYVPGAVTWEQAFLPSTLNPAPLLKEADFWSYICQLVSLLKGVHDAGLACRAMTPTKILLSPGNRLHVNCLGLLDVLFPQTNTPPEQLQYADLTAFGDFLLATACRNTKVYNLEVLKQQSRYSPPLLQFISMVVSNPPTNVYALLPYLMDRYVEELSHMSRYVDTMEAELQKELQNGRLFRILCKLGFMNERPEYEADPSWSETGDRYILKLFRDYLFHQADEKGHPRVDWGHLVTSLNKLDAGSEEKVVLGSRDGNNLLLVSFHDLKKLIDIAFQELQAKSLAADYLQGLY